MYSLEVGNGRWLMDPAKDVCDLTVTALLKERHVFLQSVEKVVLFQVRHASRPGVVFMLLTSHDPSHKVESTDGGA